MNQSDEINSVGLFLVWIFSGEFGSHFINEFPVDNGI